MSNYKRSKVLNIGNKDQATDGVMIYNTVGAGRATFQDNFGGTFDLQVADDTSTVFDINVESFWGSVPAGMTAFGLYYRGSYRKNPDLSQLDMS
jgi:hypothetical protein|tara:strand:+ start:447 stop:728 length:282 start_codon:yes stop_codon:yes gene_type:complete